MMMYPPAINHGHGKSPLYGVVFPSKPPSLPGFSIARFDYQGVFQDVLPNRPASLGQAESCRSAADFFGWDPTTFRLCPSRPWTTPYKVYVICDWLVVQNVFDTTNDKFSCFSGLLKPSDHPDISIDISRPSGAAEDLPEFSTHWSSVAWLKRGPGRQRTMKCGGIPKLCENSHGSGVFQCRLGECIPVMLMVMAALPVQQQHLWPELTMASLLDVWGHMEAFDRATPLVWGKHHLWTQTIRNTSKQSSP